MVKASPPLSSTHSSRLKALRHELGKQKLDAYLVPRQDEFHGEYVAAYAERLNWLTGFSGSWGIAIVAPTKAAIFVDGRYSVQVRQQVNKKLFQPFHLIDEPPTHWIKKYLPKGAKLGFDPWLISIEQTKTLEQACRENGISLISVETNLIDEIWSDQPKRPKTTLTVHAKKYAGKTIDVKLKEIAKQLQRKDIDAAILTQPDSIAWAFNIRAQDIPFTPIALCFAILKSKGKSQIFIDKDRITKEIKNHFGSQVAVKASEDFSKELQKLGSSKANIQLDPASASDAIQTILLKAGAKISAAADPCLLPKARKNTQEQKGAQHAHTIDGTAMVRFLCWLESKVAHEQITEISAAQKLESLRRSAGALDLSFATIAAYAANAALPHYQPTEHSNHILEQNSIFLIDSGGQYREGTTDITRTIIIGKPSAEMKDRFTRVLKGMIAISNLRFPPKTTGGQIDILARQALWQVGLDYDHGTGHGVGSFLSVHEGPIRIARKDSPALEVGMILSNEPGYYKKGYYGIRIENLILVEKSEPLECDEYDMLCFKTLTLCPIDCQLIDFSLLTEIEKKWLSDYHHRVLRELGPLLANHEQVWLKEACEACHPANA